MSANEMVSVFLSFVVPIVVMNLIFFGLGLSMVSRKKSSSIDRHLGGGYPDDTVDDDNSLYKIEYGDPDQLAEDKEFLESLIEYNKNSKEELKDLFEDFKEEVATFEQFVADKEYELAEREAILDEALADVDAGCREDDTFTNDLDESSE